MPLLEICKKSINEGLVNESEALFVHEMAGMGFDDQPHLLPGGELQGIAGGQGEVDFHFDSALHPGRLR